MANQDTIKLLRECDAGIKMGIASIDDVMDQISAEPFRQCLKKSKTEHEKLKTDIQVILAENRDDGKEPGAMAKGMSWIKTNIKLAMDDSDATIADLMTDGCNMGVKSLNKYLNQYKSADQKAKDITVRLSALEEQLAVDIRPYL